MKKILVLGMLLALVLTAFVTPVSAKNYADWSAPVNLGPVINSSNIESCPCIAKDGLSLYFASNVTGQYDLYVSHRSRTDLPWGAPFRLGTAINTEYGDRCPYVTPDERTLIFVSDGRPGGKGSGDFYVSCRKDKKDDLGWTPAVNITDINTTANVMAMWGFEEQGVLELYFGSSNLSGTGPFDIYSTTMTKDGKFTPAAPVPELVSPYHESMPVVSKDGLEMFLNVTGRSDSFGGADIYVSTRQKTSDPWSAPVNLGPVVNSAADDSRAALSWDGTTIIFTSLRAGLGSWDLWTASRSSQKPEYTFTTIDHPGTIGFAYDISPGGEIVGMYLDGGKFHGFALTGGKFTTLDYPRDGVTFMRPNGIAPSGDINGYYTAGGVNHGFVLTKTGEWSTVDYTGYDNTVLTRILPDGTLIGVAFPMGGGDTEAMRGVVMGRDRNVVLDKPGICPYGATPDGKILVGYDKGADFVSPWRAWIIDNGDFTPFRFPGSLWSMAWDISPDGSTIVGSYGYDLSTGHGFLAERHGTSVDDWEFTAIDVPGSRATTLHGCNPAGDLVGRYVDASGKSHLFLASRSSGK